MKTKPKKTSIVLIVILYLLAIAFLAYGVYIAVYSANYVQSYQSSTSVATENAIQYVVTSSIAYFGFAIIIFIGAVILTNINRLQNAVYRTLQHDKNREYESSTADDDSEQLDFPTKKASDEQKTNPYYSEPKNKPSSEEKSSVKIVNEPPTTTKKELKAEKKEAKLREKRAAEEATVVAAPVGKPVRPKKKTEKAFEATDEINKNEKEQKSDNAIPISVIENIFEKK